MIDFHTHTLFSDGELLPAELMRRAKVTGYRVLGITDHADASNLDWIIPRICRACERAEEDFGVRVIPGIELTHVPPRRIAELVEAARNLGARLVVAHGESIAEPVARGTNLAALEAGVDILAHPGLLTYSEAELAAERGIFLEITTRRGHSLTNGHVVRLARQVGAKLVVSTDAHGPDDLVTKEQAQKVARGAGLEEGEMAELWREVWAFATRLLDSR